MSTTSVPITGLMAAASSWMLVLDALASDLDGPLLRPDDEGYAESVSLWNGMITKRPAIVVRGRIGRRRRPNGAIRRRSRDRAVDPRRGPQHRRPRALRRRDDPGHVRPQCRRGRSGARIARVQAGALLGDVDRATQQHGLVATLGFVSLTGVAGLTLGGGFGYLTRRFGWTVDDLEEVESSLPMARSLGRRATRTPICSGPSEAAAATSGSSPSSRSACTRSGRRSPADRSRGRPRRRSESSMPSVGSRIRHRAS